MFPLDEIGLIILGISLFIGFILMLISGIGE